jgi:hypothetical protein
MVYNQKIYASIKKWRENNIDKYREYDKLKHRKSDIRKCVWLRATHSLRRIDPNYFLV